MLVFFAIGLLVGLVIGILYQHSRAVKRVDEIRRECSQQISRAFTEGRTQGHTEALQKRRYTK